MFRRCTTKRKSILPNHQINRTNSRGNGSVAFECITYAGLQLLREKTLPPTSLRYPQDRANSLLPSYFKHWSARLQWQFLLCGNLVAFNVEPYLDLIYSGGCNSWLQWVYRVQSFDIEKTKPAENFGADTCSFSSPFFPKSFLTSVKCKQCSL